MLGVNTNIASIDSQRYLSKTSNQLNTSIQRLSSGLRINSAKDDAAGLAISTRMNAQVRGLNQASRNASDGISVAQTAEGALGEIGNMLQRMRELAVQSANDSNSASDRLSLQKEFAQLNSEIDRLGTQTEFNGKKVLDGTFTSALFQVGANANQTISVSITDSRATAIGAYTVSGKANVGGAIALAGDATGGNNVVAQNLTLSGPVGSATVSSSTIGTDATAYAIAAGVNNVTGSTGVSATAVTTSTITALSVAGAVSFTLGGKSTATVSATVSSATDMTTLAQAINDVAATTGISATLASDKGSISLSQSEGYNISVVDYTNGGAANATMTMAGVTLYESAGANDSVVVGGKVSFSATGAFTVTSDDGTNTVLSGATTASGTLSAVSSAKVDTQTNSNSAITTLDGAISYINDLRATLGAIQSRFESAISNLGTASENISAAKSRILDADFASETASLTRAQILQQAGTAMLAQANQLPQGVLSLLRG